MNLYLYSKHNYFNRRIISYNNIEDYSTNFSDEIIFTGVNFNPNDGISTTQIINYTEAEDYFGSREGSQSYCVVVDSEIVSRWWITETRRVRRGQIELKLLRDVIADYKDLILSAPAFITKGYINSTEDSAIFNNEDLTYNQIKKSEQTLRDASRTAWYLFYLKEGIPEDKRTVTIPKPSFNLNGIYDTRDQYPYSAYMNPEKPFIGDYDSIGYNLYWYNNYATDHESFVSSWRDNGQVYATSIGGARVSSLAGEGVSITGKKSTGMAAKIGVDPMVTIQDVVRGINSAIRSEAPSLDFRGGSYVLTGAHTGTALDSFLLENGKYYQFGGTIYRIKINKSYVTKQVVVPNSNVYAGNYLTIANSSGTLNTSSINGTYAAIEFTAPTYYITLEAVPESTITYTLPLNAVESTDSPYSILAIPHGFIFMDDGEDVSTNVELTKTLVNQILRSWSSYILDAQLLPYAPIDDFYFTKLSPYTSRIHLQSFPSDASYYTVVGDTVGEQTIVLYINQTSWTKTINDYTLQVPSEVIDFKVANETDMYRLCSPNYNGQFEFSATKNGGVSSWNIAFNYRPFTPYIKVAPNFGRLYGKDFGDARGLICGGDFSITQSSSAWNDYQLQNKNYLNIFDRQIENMEVKNNVQRQLEKLNVATGALTGAVSAGGAGMMTGNPYVAAASAAVGGGTSLWGGYKDIELNEKLRQEALSLEHDNFGYNLQNIRAMPYSLAKVGVQNADYKSFPFIEYYTCTDIEKEALINKLTWDGFTVGRIDYINNFLKASATDTGTYIQARPIRLLSEGFIEDSHIADVISAELRTGVYFV